MTVISQKQIIKATLQGINESVTLYQTWSGGEWLCNAPEYLLTVKIAENIAIKINKHNENNLITLEDNVDYLLDIAQAKGRGPVPKKVRKNGRCDITMWHENEKPRALIEVKNSVFSLKKIELDIDRIKEILKSNTSKSTFEFGLIAFYIDRHYDTGNATTKIKKQADKIFNQAKELNKDVSFEMFYKEQKQSQKDIDAWASVVFLITRNDSKYCST